MEDFMRLVKLKVIVSELRSALRNVNCNSIEDLEINTKAQERLRDYVNVFVSEYSKLGSNVLLKLSSSVFVGGRAVKKMKRCYLIRDYSEMWKLLVLVDKYILFDLETAISRLSLH